jgi:mRNA interferase MazF
VKPGDLALVRFPFTELAAAKKRPAPVLARTIKSSRHRLATVAMVTSQMEALKLDGDILLAGGKAAGLLHPSPLRLAKIATIDADLVDRVIGALSASDLGAARSAFHRVFEPWLR